MVSIGLMIAFNFGAGLRSRSFPIDLSSLWSKPTRIGFSSKSV
jgi:hypothetical protein